LPLRAWLSGELPGFLSGDFVLFIRSSETAADRKLGVRAAQVRSEVLRPRRSPRFRSG
jgi:hypothetical protein